MNPLPGNRSIPDCSVIPELPYADAREAAAWLGGHVWTFSQTLADVDPAQWGGEMLAPTVVGVE